MPSILAIDWQVARHLEIRVQDVVMQAVFTESKDGRLVLEHKCFKICEGGGGDLDLELPGLLFDFA